MSAGRTTVMALAAVLASSGLAHAGDTGPATVYQREAAMSADMLIARWEPYIKEAAARFQIPAAWIRAVMIVESRGHTTLTEGAPITSPKGAMGLMQVMPASWQTVHDAYALGTDPYEPRSNILAGAAILRLLYTQYGYPGLFAAYNDGPGDVDARRQAGQALPDETAAYVMEIAHILRTGHRRVDDPPVDKRAFAAPADDGVTEAALPRAAESPDDGLESDGD